MFKCLFFHCINCDNRLHHRYSTVYFFHCITYDNRLHIRCSTIYFVPCINCDNWLHPMVISIDMFDWRYIVCTEVSVTIDSTFNVRLFIVSTVRDMSDNWLHHRYSTVYFSTVTPVTIDSTIDVRLSIVSTVLPETIDSTIDGRQSDATAVSLNKQTADEILSPKLRARSQFRENAWCPPDRLGVGLMNGFSIKAVECVAGGGRAEKLFHYYCTRPSLKWTVAIALWLIRHCHRYLGEYIISKCWSEMS